MVEIIGRNLRGIAISQQGQLLCLVDSIANFPGSEIEFSRKFAQNDFLGDNVPIPDQVVLP